MKIIKIKLLFIILFLISACSSIPKILQIAVQYLMKDIYGLNMQENQKKNGELLFICSLLL